MLTRLEVAYLAMLRVVLLIAATTALIITFGAAVTALPALVKVVGVGGHEPTRGATLGEFIDANRITGVHASNEDLANGTAKYPLSDDVTKASRVFARYDAHNNGARLNQSQWDDLFRSILIEKVPVSEQTDYGSDLLKLSNQLDRSSGKPLSDERTFQLIEFHLSSFLANAEAREIAKSAQTAASMSKLLLAGGAFLIFVLVLFSFLFVKIERNLRVRHAPEELAGV